MPSPSKKIGYSTSGWRVYMVNAGYEVKCSQCGRVIFGEFTRKGTQPICRTCRPFEIERKAGN